VTATGAMLSSIGRLRMYRPGYSPELLLSPERRASRSRQELPGLVTVLGGSGCCAAC